MPFNAGQLKAIQQRDSSILVSALREVEKRNSCQSYY